MSLEAAPNPNLRLHLRELADPAHAAFHKAYHKSPRKFFGLRTAQLKLVLMDCFPRSSHCRQNLVPLALELWHSEWFEERVAAIWLLEQVAKQLVPEDIHWLFEFIRDCEGWAETDFLTTRVLGVLALEHGKAVYRPVFGWSTDACLWVRRGSILIHVIPARRSCLDEDYSWTTFDERLFESEFFIRKAIGWALRECSKHYPQQVAEFLARVGNRASGLTRREGARNLPDNLRQTALG